MKELNEDMCLYIYVCSLTRRQRFSYHFSFSLDSPVALCQKKHPKGALLIWTRENPFCELVLNTLSDPTIYYNVCPTCLKEFKRAFLLREMGT